MPQPIVYIDTSAVRNGKLEELEAAMNKLAEFVEAIEVALRNLSSTVTRGG